MAKKVLIALGIIVVLGVVVYFNTAFKRTPGVSVTTEKVERRDLESVVSASGKIQPKRSVNISAETMGKVVDLSVNEGDYVKAGQPLLQIDPKNLETNVENREASLATQRSQLEQTKSQVENAKLALSQAKIALTRAEAAWNAQLIPRLQYEQAQDAVKTAQLSLANSETSVKTQEQRIKQEDALLATAKNDLEKVRIVSPIDGIVTRRNIEKGETAVVGTMNNAGTVLLTIADLSVIETEIEVDETDIPDIRIGQPAKVTIDAIKDKEFPGKVTEVGNSPIQVTGSTTRATNFKVTVTIDGTVPNVRPGFTCTAVVTTATRQKAIAVPIQAMTVREMIVDEGGNIVRTEPARAGGAGAKPPAGGAAPAPAAAGEKTVAGKVAQATAPAGRGAGAADLAPGQSRKEIEGVFLVKDGRVAFTPVKTGVAGEKFFEVLDGLKEGDEVITGPFQSVRGMRDGDQVKVTSGTTTSTTEKK
jgi:HlyD family secretion protein